MTKINLCLLQIILSLCLLYLFIGSAHSQDISEKGYFLSIRNFTPRDYKGLPQNFDVVMDPRGVLFFANTFGLLEYDGISWKIIEKTQEGEFTCLAVDTRGVVYAGGNNEFGYLKPNHSGSLDFISLTPQLDSTEKTFTFLKICTSENAVFFQTENEIFCWDGYKMKTWTFTDKLFTSFFMHGKYYLQIAGKGLFRLEKESFIKLPDGAKLAKYFISGMITYKEKDILIVTQEDGFFHLFTDNNIEKIRVIRHFNELDNFIRDNQVNCAVRVNKDQFALGTEGSGVVIYNEVSDNLDLINFSVGLQNQLVKNILLDTRGNLWMTLSNGISMSPAGSSVTSFGYLSGLKEGVESVCRYQNKLFAATAVGCFYLTSYQTNPDLGPNIFNPLYNKSGFVQVKGIAEACYHVDKFQYKQENLLLISAGSAIFEMGQNLSVHKVKDASPWSIMQSKKYSDRVIIANSDGIESMFRKDEKWVLEGYVPGIEDDCIVLAEDSTGNVWVGSNKMNLYRIRYNSPGLKQIPEVEKFDTSCGLPDGYIHVCYFNNRLLIGTVNGLYKHIESNNQFIPDTSFPKDFWDGSREIHRVSIDNEGNIWLVTIVKKTEEYETGYLEQINDSEYQWVMEPFLGFSKNLLHALYHDKDGISWLGGPTGLYRYDRNISKDYKQDFNALLRKVVIGGDSVFFKGTFSDKNGLPVLNQPVSAAPVIKYSLNSILFEYSAPINEDGSPVLFRQMLEGYEKKWSEWGPEYRKEYTNLKEGQYKFRLCSKNMYNHESDETYFGFSILPPWYRTTPAYILFFVLISGALYLIIALYTRGLRNIIRERTAEIRLKKEEIERKNKDILDSIQYARRIQSALLPPGDYLNDILPERFVLYLPRDIVSGDFYWLKKHNEQIIYVTADCTGHGVPGAMMSMLGMAFLNDIVNKIGELSANNILDELRAKIVDSMRQTGQSGENQDGMDIALSIIDPKTLSLQFAGANLSLYLVRDGNIREIKGDSMPIGISSSMDQPFTLFNMQLEKDDQFYTFSDGFQDQFGGPKQKKYLISRLRNLLVSISHNPMPEQKILLENEFRSWTINTEQVDDILIMGMRV